MTWRSDRVLKDLVTAVASAEDPALYERACTVLAALLAEYAGND